MCLPVFLASCSTILVLLGPTYLSRIWCVVELFVFLQMGGTPDRIELLTPSRAPLARGGVGDDAACAQSASAPAVLGAIHAFDVRRASCLRLEEREKLLTVIEVGFGGLSTFNDMIVQLLLMAAQRSARTDRSSRSPERSPIASAVRKLRIVETFVQALPSAARQERQHARETLG